MKDKVGWDGRISAGRGFVCVRGYRQPGAGETREGEGAHVASAEDYTVDALLDTAVCKAYAAVLDGELGDLRYEFYS
jgi:hypothetical protein